MTSVDWIHRLRCGEGLKPGWNGIMQLANGLVAAGMPDTSIRTLLLDESHEGNSYINVDSNGRPRPRATRERFARNAIHKAREFQRSAAPLQDRAQATEKLVRLREAVDRDPTRWKGRGGATDRAVLYAAFDIAIARGSLEFNAPVRQLADGANVGVRGAHAATHRLRDWFTVVTLGAGTRASTFRFRPEEPTATLSVLVETEPEGCSEYLSLDI